MPHSLGADEFVGKLLNIMRTTAQDHYLKARIVIQVGVQRRDDYFVVFMLKVGQFFREEANVMVIDQRHGSHDGGLRCHDRRPHQPIPDQVPERLGTVVVAFFSNELVKTTK